ncbi:acetyl esterase [Panacagrimonas perspica]|uniref:Acetyl esterase n=1 Tax=Panacagrimonas perspica TaxID=381431 RepID=A0A4V3URI0_9GAMM|nr:alpha/beta hydrolase [Panacagrimonas perspica]TDU31822.1 acetyl esterase [Panacagrimonas perspica]THD02971.1 hypothetical protein B1810_10220 [Panacagrimonas perspica]
MALHPQVEEFLKRVAAAGGWSFRELGVTECRAAYSRVLRSLPPCTRPLAKVEDRGVEGASSLPVKVRIYTPQGEGPFPVLVFFHGGGFVIGDLDSHDNVCRELASGAGVIVVSVDYRLAPEHRFPAGIDDAVAMTRWACASAATFGGDPARVAVGGDSAGGNFAAVVARRMRDEGTRIAAQLLVYPTTRLDDVVMPSMVENAVGYRLERADMDWFRSLYLSSDADGFNVDASPILASDLSGLAPALVQTCEYDPLRDEGEAYGRALQSAGVRTVVERYDGTIHGSFGLYAMLEPGRRMMDRAIEWLRETLRS